MAAGQKSKVRTIKEIPSRKNGKSFQDEVKIAEIVNIKMRHTPSLILFL